MVFIFIILMSAFSHLCGRVIEVEVSSSETLYQFRPLRSNLEVQ